MTSTEEILEPAKGGRTDSSKPPTILRDVVIYLAASGDNTAMFPTYVYLVRVEEAESEALIWTNEPDTPELTSGTNDQGFHAGILTWLFRWRPTILERLSPWLAESRDDRAGLHAELYGGRTLTIIASEGDMVLKAYREPTANLVATGFLKADGRHWGNAAWIARVLAKAEELGVTVTCRSADTIHERATLELVRNECKRRWQRAKRDTKARFVA